MKSANDLLIEINAASRRTRDAALLALLGDLKTFLEQNPPAHSMSAPLEPREGRPKRPRRSKGKMPEREAQLRKNRYMRSYMKERRHKQKEANLASNTPTSNTDRDRDPSARSIAGTHGKAETVAPESGKRSPVGEAYSQAEEFTQAQGKPPWEDE